MKTLKIRHISPPGSFLLVSLMPQGIQCCRSRRVFFKFVFPLVFLMPHGIQKYSFAGSGGSLFSISSSFFCNRESNHAVLQVPFCFFLFVLLIPQGIQKHSFAGSGGSFFLSLSSFLYAWETNFHLKNCPQKTCENMSRAFFDFCWGPTISLKDSTLTLKYSLLFYSFNFLFSWS